MSSSGLTNSNMIIMSNTSNNYNNNSLQIKQEDKFFSRLLSKESSSASPSSRRLYYAGLPGSVPFLWESQPGTPKRPFCDDHHQDLLHQAPDPDDDHHLNPPSFPPLTPPPSYFNNKNKKKKMEKLDDHPRDRDHDHDHHHHHKRSRSLNLLSSIFPKRLNIGYHALVIKFIKSPGHNMSAVSPSNKCTSESSSMLDHGHYCFGSPTTAFGARSASSWFSSSSSTTSFDSRGEELEDHHQVGDNDDASPNSTLCFFGCYRR